jgi:hypothetical protein
MSADDMKTIHLTLYAGALDARPLRQDDFESWPELVESLRDLVSREGEPEDDEGNAKKGLLAFGPHRLNKPHRNLQNIDHVSLLVLDCDDVPVLPVCERLVELGLPAVVYTSPGDDPHGDPERRRFRVVAPVSRPIAVEECYRTRFAFAEALGLDESCGVGQAKDAAKLFFCGRYAGAPEREFLVFGAGA